MVNLSKSYYVFGQLDFTWIPANAPPAFGTALPLNRGVPHVPRKSHPLRLQEADCEGGGGQYGGLNFLHSNSFFYFF